MKTIATALMSACLALAAGGVAAQSTKTTEPDTATTQMKQQCRDLMVSKKDGAMVKDKDPASMTKQEQQCAEMMKKDGKTKKDASGEPMKY